jgi:hypothetical protein
MESPFSSGQGVVSVYWLKVVVYSAVLNKIKPLYMKIRLLFLLVLGFFTSNAVYTQSTSVSISSNAPLNTICYGNPVTFTATPSGTSNPIYQWKKNGSAISGATSATYTTSSLVNNDAISVDMSVEVTNFVTSDMVLHLDAGNSASYPGTGTTWTDLSGNGNHATLPSALVSGYSATEGGGSFLFQHNSSTPITSSAMTNWNLGTTNAISVETWVKQTLSGDHQFWFSTPDLKYRLGINPSGNLFWDMAHYVDRTTSNNVSENVWHHVVYTAGVEAGNITTRIYIDGVFAASQNEGVSALSSFTNYLIGSGQNINQHQLNAYMGLIRVYNKALSASEVTQNYQAQLGRFAGTVSSGLVLNLDASNATSYPGTGTTWFDLSGNSNDVTMQNSGNITWNSSGYFSLTGDGYFNRATTTNLPMGNSSYSLSVWVRLPASWSAQGFISVGGFEATNRSNAFRTNGTNGYSHYWWDNDLSPNNGTLSPTTSWFYALAQFDGTIRSIWINGVQLASNTPSGHNVTSSLLQVGKTHSGPYEWLNGDIGKALIYNRALSSTEISQNYYAEKPRFDAPPPVGSNTITMTVSTYSGGTLASSAAVCSGITSTTLSISGYTGSIVKWQSSTDNWATASDINLTTTSLLATGLPATTKFRVVILSGGCQGNSNDVTVVP